MKNLNFISFYLVFVAEAVSLIDRIFILVHGQSYDVDDIWVCISNRDVDHKFLKIYFGQPNINWVIAWTDLYLNCNISPNRISI